ncbi:IdgA domain protein [Zymoseptoria brevis]|uniref:IdgA domain protein n=1 Tax=Zymoseptoria brevis TaxID=1047168 RepID=A0A0F4GKX3_9PEZI|nr:IdgA domain protein [Zymoseptoria brevis]
MAALPWLCRTGRTMTARQQVFSSSFISKRTITSNSKFFQVSEEIRQAISEKKPVVALETTIYTHGYPYPTNVKLAARLEELVRQHGGVPATIGILDGVARVGLTADETTRLASSPGSPNVLKISRRDICFALGLKDASGNPFNGGTTIAGTSVLAHMAGIKIFATGGLGGVHRGAEQTMDVSADLTELGRTPITVISAGCKSFLDIAKTLEVLETQGVAVATFADGRSGSVDFPAFYSRDSGVPSPVTLQNEMDAARVIYAQYALGLQSGMHFANPIPEEHEIPFAKMEVAIAEALQAANAAGQTGARATPFILDKIKSITGSKSVEANTALVEANIIRGTKVAVALQQLEREGLGDHALNETQSIVTGPAASNYSPQGVPISYASAAQSSPSPTTPSPGNSSAPLTSPEQRADIFVAGSLAVDLACDFTPRSSSSHTPALETSNPARIAQSLGGVGHNVAYAAHLMGASVQLCSAVGSDLTGKAALEALSTAGLSTAGIATFPADSGARTAQYIAINDAHKDLVVAMADMSILETPSTTSSIIKETFDKFWLPQLQISRPTHFVVDGNWPAEYLILWLRAAKSTNAQVLFEPVSTTKSTIPFQLTGEDTLATYPHPSIHLSTPNIHELTSMHAAARSAGLMDREDWWSVIDALGIPPTGARTAFALATSSALVDQGIPQQAVQLLPFIPTLLTKLGAEGVLLTQLLSADDSRLTSPEARQYIVSRCRNGTEDSLGVGGVYMRLFPPAARVPAEEVVSVNGVGDTFAGVIVAGLAKAKKEGREARVEDLVGVAQRAAIVTLKSEGGVGKDVSRMMEEL